MEVNFTLDNISETAKQFIAELKQKATNCSHFMERWAQVKQLLYMHCAMH